MTLMFPHEAEVLVEIAKQYCVQHDAMTGLHNEVVAMLMTADSWTITKRSIHSLSAR